MNRSTSVMLGALVLGFAPGAALGGSLERVTTLPWGAGAGEVGLVAVPDGRYGPQDAAFDLDGSVWILDTQNERAFRLDAPGEVRRVQPGAVLLAVDSGRISTLSATGRMEAELADGVSAWTAATGFPLSLAFRGGLPVVALYGTALFEGGQTARAVVERPGLASVTLTGADGLSNGYSISFPDLIALNPVGRTPAGALIVDAQSAPEGIDGPIARSALVVSPGGRIEASLAVPPRRFAAARRDLWSAADGRVFVMLSDETGVEIWRWDTAPGATFPAEYSRTPLAPLDGLAADDSHDALPAPPEEVTRSEALAIAKGFDDHVWTATLKNITTTTCTDWCGKTKTIDPPDWVVEGQNTRFAYCWGGFSSVDSFDQGLLADKKAGDKQTKYGDGSSACGSSCAVGVDCSGFVSRCWKAGSHYGTSQMDQITAAISKSDLKPADALNNAGSHVRLFVGTRADGNWDMVESYAGSGYWGVGYTVRSPADNSSYDAIRYDLIEDDPVTPHDPPVITHTPVTSAAPGRDIVIAASVTTSTGQVPAFNLRHRKSGDVDWTLVPFTDKGGFHFEAVIAGSAVSPGVVEYWMAVWDGENPPQDGRNRVTLPADAETAFHYFEIDVETPDAGAADTGVADTGIADAGRDGGSTTADVGQSDAGGDDAASADTGSMIADTGSAPDTGSTAVLCGQYQIVEGYQDRPCANNGEECDKLAAMCDGAVKPVCTCRGGVWDCLTGECAPCIEGSLRCSGTRNVELCHGGRWVDSVACGTGTACAGGRCVASLTEDAGSAPSGSKPSLSDDETEAGGCACTAAGISELGR